MAIRPDEITEILKRQLAEYEPSLEFRSSGLVLSVGDGIARVYGLQQAMSGELIEFPAGLFGIALNLEEDNVGCILLGSDEQLREGDTARCTGRLTEVPVGEEVLGRVINPLGQPLDGKGDITFDATRPIEASAPGVVDRQPVKEPLQTGIKCVDAMTPIGRGQRELIIGDRQTGKTALAVDTIINQRDTEVVCIYVAIGQKMSTVAQVQSALEREGAMDYTVIVVAGAADAAAMQYIAPYAGCAIGEYMRDEGKHALIVYDDLTKHSEAYRQVSLLLRRPPGREAFPGDVFNLHSRLLERAAKLNDELGGGSLTALPIVETKLGDYSAYIPTNVISITDGQIYLENDLFYSGVRPAMNVGISVSRVGGNAQIPAMKKLAGTLRLDLAQYRDVEAFAQFSSDLDPATKAQLQRGQHMVEALKQDQYAPLSVTDQVVVLFAGTKGHLDALKLDQVRPFEAFLLKFVHTEHADLVDTLKREPKLNDALIATLDEVCKQALEQFAAQEANKPGA